MAKPRSARKAGGGGGGGGGGGRRRAEPQDLPSDLEMEEERLARSRDKLHLDVRDDAVGDDDSLDEEEVMGLGSEGSEGEDDSEDWDSEDDTNYGRRECRRVLRAACCAALSRSRGGAARKINV